MSDEQEIKHLRRKLAGIGLTLINLQLCRHEGTGLCPGCRLAVERELKSLDKERAKWEP